eukprot:SAG31_NODE_10667_length_1112_cov_0.925962_2_plen_63_part_00
MENYPLTSTRVEEGASPSPDVVLGQALVEGNTTVHNRGHSVALGVCHSELVGVYLAREAAQS